MTREGVSMGTIATQAQETKLATANPASDFRTLLTRAWPRIKAVLPSHVSPERLYQMWVSTINQTPKLAECTPYSLLSCIMKCSALGMEPSAVDGLGRAYILPFFNKKSGRMEATFILGYKGIIDLARRSGQIASIETGAIYNGENVRYWIDDDGKHLEHEPSLDGAHDLRDFRGAYCRVAFTNGGKMVEYMSRAEIEAIKKRSKSANYGPWVTDYEAMARKTVLRRAAPYMPMSVEAHEAIERADETTPDYGALFTPIVEPDVVEDVEPEYEGVTDGD